MKSSQLKTMPTPSRQHTLHDGDWCNNCKAPGLLRGPHSPLACFALTLSAKHWFDSTGRYTTVSPHWTVIHRFLTVYPSHQPRWNPWGKPLGPEQYFTLTFKQTHPRTASVSIPGLHGQTPRNFPVFLSHCQYYSQTSEITFQKTPKKQKTLGNVSKILSVSVSFVAFSVDPTQRFKIKVGSYLCE